MMGSIFKVPSMSFRVNLPVDASVKMIVSDLEDQGYKTILSKTRKVVLFASKPQDREPMGRMVLKLSKSEDVTFISTHLQPISLTGRFDNRARVQFSETVAHLVNAASRRKTLVNASPIVEKANISSPGFTVLDFLGQMLS